MDLQIKRYDGSYEEQWDAFTNSEAKNSTFLHTRKFFNHNPANKEDDCSILFFKKGLIAAVLPAVCYQNGNGKVLHSHYRSTYGGLIYSNDLSVGDLNQCIELLIRYAKEQGISEIIVRPSFHIYHKTLSEEQDYLLWKNGFTIKSRELELAIDLQPQIEEQYAGGSLRSIKKAYKLGVEVKESDRMEDFWMILEKNLNEKYGRRPVHQISEIRALQNFVGADKIKLIAAFLDDRMLGGILVFIANDLVVHAQYIASDNDFQEYRPLNAVIDFIARKSKVEGFKFFNLGMVNEPGGEILNEGLTRFKEGFGARGVLRETMHIKLV